MGRPLKFQDVDKLQEMIDDYFETMDKEKRPYTICGLAVHLDTCRDTLLEYQDKQEFSDTIKKAKDKIQAWTEEQLYRNTQVTGVIFNLKNNYGWKDKTEIESTNRNYNIDNMTEEEIDKELERLKKMGKQNDGQAD